MFRQARIVALTLALTVCMLFGAHAISQAETVSFWTQYATNKVLNEVLDDFTKDTGIEVTLKPIDWGTEAIFVAHAGGALPDLFTHGSAALGVFASQGILTPLEPLMAKWTFLKDLVPAVKAGGMYDGKQLVIAFNGITVRDLVYPLGVMAEAGLSPKQLPPDWDGFAQVARRLVKRDADGRLTRSAIALPQSGAGAQQMWSLFLNQAGGDILTNGVPQLNEGPAVQAMQYYTDLIHRYRLDDIGFGGTVGKGTSAMTWTSWGNIKPLIDKGVEVGVSTFPYKKRPASFLAMDWAGIPKSASNPAGAARLLEYLLRPEQQQRLNQAFGGATPFYRNAIQWDWVKSSPQLLHLFAASAYAIPNPPHPKWFEMRDELVKNITSALKQAVSPDTAMLQVHEAILRLVTAK